MRYKVLLTLTFSAVFFVSLASTLFPSHRAIAKEISIPTHKICHLCDQTTAQAVVRVILFWMNGCPHCHEVIDHVLPPLREQYGSQLEIRMIEVSSMEDINRLYEIGAAYGLQPEQIGVPLLIIGDHVLVGSRQIPEQLPSLVERYLNSGGIDYPQIPQLAYFAAASPSAETVQQTTTPPTPQSRPLPEAADAGGQPLAGELNYPAPTQPKSNGFTLAIIILIGMVLILLYGIGALVINKSIVIPDSFNRYAYPILSVIGLGVALYLAYVETQEVPAVCGPVGDCNAVQQSPYAKLFGILPVGVLGAIGYVGILAVWFWGRLRKDWVAEKAPLALFVMTLFGLLFSIYLTYLEPFVIKAVCIWCLTSAVIMAALYFLSIHPLVRKWQTDLEAATFELETEEG